RAPKPRMARSVRADVCPGSMQRFSVTQRDPSTSLGMTANRTLVTFLCLVFRITASAFAQADFAKANQEFSQGHFKEAVDGYEGSGGTGQGNANLSYDRGNAYFRSCDFGRAILKYERALALDSHHPEATANLQIARDESRALELQPTKLERYVQFASI